MQSTESDGKQNGSAPTERVVVTASTPIHLSVPQIVGLLVVPIGIVIWFSVQMASLRSDLASKTEVSELRTDVKALTLQVQNLATENAKLTERLDTTIKALEKSTAALESLRDQLPKKKP